jgi:hypothetical protein
MNLFESNNKAQSGMASPLTGLFEISLDKSIPYYIEDKDAVQERLLGIYFWTSL